MEQKKLIVALKKISEGCEELISVLGAEETNIPKAADKPVSKKDNEPMNPPETTGSGYSRDELMSMGYNDLKKYGASIGVKCTGSRDDIVNKVLAKQGESADAPEEKTEKTEKTKKSDKVVPIAKGAKKTKSAEPEVEQEWLDLANEVAEEADEADIVEALNEGGVDVPKGTKKSALIVMLAEAIRDGKVVLDDDSENDEVAEAAESAEAPEGDDDEEGEEIDENTHFEEYDENHVNDLEAEHMTDERAAAIRKFQGEILEELDEECMKEFVDNTCTEDELAQLGDEYELEELLGLYLETKKRMIDDEGELHEAGDPYEIAGGAYCCGHELKYDKKGKKYICEVCGNEYEAE